MSLSNNIEDLNNKKDITIILVLYKETLELVSQTLSSLQFFKVIIIDNGNDEKLKKKIEDQFVIEKYILNKKNTGFSAGYNQGIKLSKTDFTLVLGPDCLIQQKDILTLKKKLSENKDCFLVSATSYDYNGNLTYTGGPLPENGEKNIVLDISGDTCVDSILGACMFFKTKNIIQNQLFFDEKFFLYYSDDDLCRRVRKLNKTIIQIYDAKCIHQHGILKIKNIFIRKFVREYNLKFDKFYYFYKIDKHQEVMNSFKKKVPSFILKLFVKILSFDFLKAVEIYSQIFAYYKFRFKILKKDD